MWSQQYANHLPCQHMPSFMSHRGALIEEQLKSAMRKNSEVDSFFRCWMLWTYTESVWFSHDETAHYKHLCCLHCLYTWPTLFTFLHQNLSLNLTSRVRRKRNVVHMFSSNYFYTDWIILSSQILTLILSKFLTLLSFMLWTLSDRAMIWCYCVMCLAFEGQKAHKSWMKQWFSIQQALPLTASNEFKGMQSHVVRTVR